MSTMNQPEVLVTITAAASAEVKKFMEAGSRRPREGRPACERSARRLQRLQVRPPHRGRGWRRRPRRRAGRMDVFVDPFSAQYLNGVIDRLCLVDAGIWLHLQEPELHGRLWLRELVLRVAALPNVRHMERSVAGTRRDAVVNARPGLRFDGSRGPPLSVFTPPRNENSFAPSSSTTTRTSRALVAERIASLIREHHAAGRGQSSASPPARRRSGSIAS